jgi:hypothetical protein
VLEALAERYGDKPIRQLERRHIRRMRDECADTPGAANTIVRMLKLLLNFAFDDGLIPAAKMKLFKVGHWRAWTDDDECEHSKAAGHQGQWKDTPMPLRCTLGSEKAISCL